MIVRQNSSVTWAFGWFLGIWSLLGLQGCLATQNYVKDQVQAVQSQVTRLDQQLTALEGRVQQNQGVLKQTRAQVATVSQQVATLELDRRLLGDLVEGVNFTTGSDRLMDEARAVLDAFVEGLGNLEDVNFYLGGYTDVRGSSRYNYELGERRATRVARYLITEKGVRPVQIRTGSHGKSTSMAAPGSEDLILDRRVNVYAYVEEIKVPGK